MKAENQISNYTSIGQLETSHICIRMKHIYITQLYHNVGTIFQAHENPSEGNHVKF
jgi:hypothetical protein